MRDLRDNPFAHLHDRCCSIAAAVTGAATLGGALISASGAQSAAKTQANAANTAANTQLTMYNQTRSDLQPYMQTGNNALAQLASLWGIGPQGGAGGQAGVPNAQAATQALTQFPGYQFGLQQGGLALDRSAASQGLLLSGAQLQASQEFGQQYAQQQAWQPYVTGLSGLATQGANAAAGVGQQGTIAANNAGTAQLAGGAASAAGQIGVANSLQSGLNNALYAYQMYGGGAGSYGGAGQLGSSGPLGSSGGGY